MAPFARRGSEAQKEGLCIEGTGTRPQALIFGVCLTRWPGAPDVLPLAAPTSRRALEGAGKT